MPIGDLLAQITGEAPSSTSAAPRPQPIPKRKADAELSRTNGKHAKIEQHAAIPSRPVAQAKPLVKTGKINMEAPVKSESKAATRPTPKPQEAPRGPPKKGSYAEIIARATNYKKTLGQMGKIQNKPFEKEAPKPVGPKGKPNIGAVPRGGPDQPTRGKPVLHSRNSQREVPGGKVGKVAEKGSKNGNKAAPPEPVKKLKKAAMATTGYTGTARPNPAAAKANPRLLISSATRPGPVPRRDSASTSRAPKPALPRRYTYAEEDEEDEEEREDYESDVSSDMEAAAFEVDEEEEKAARLGKLEDKEQEERLRREAAEKQRRLAQRAGR